MIRTKGLDPNLAAFLGTLYVSELTQALIDVTDDGYNVLVGATPDVPLIFKSYARHPNVLNRRLNSTAAGAGQIIHPTWASVAARVRLIDFSPESQDAAVIELIREDHGALGYVLAGQFDQAVMSCAPTWASLPGSTAGQHVQALEHLRAVYQGLGGRFA